MNAPAPATRPDGLAFWAGIFGDPAPVEIEIGSGDGAFLLARAAATPRRNLLGIERSPGKSRRLAARVARLGSPHVRTLQADATYALAMVPAASVSAVHVYFPDPWPKRRHVPRRIFSPSFVAALARVLPADGALYVATDVAPYMARIRAVVLADRRFAEVSTGDDHPGLSTGFARKYRAEGRPLHTASFRRAAELSPGPRP
ncbi:MAG TPA: tRNA (guanosine(46)-N7)-methyltransferase TrmB [Candidatus Binatia bacterium]|jgi:tRNA (guanine-N7-)-methyltransferase